MNRLEGKSALITGGSRGIGEGIVRRLVSEGCKVMIADVLEKEGQALADELSDSAQFRKLDVRSAEEWAATIAECETAFGKLDILVNNAGILMFKAIDDYSEEDIRRILDVNLIGVILGTQAAIPALERAGGGSIVNMSSTDGIKGANALTIYCASKFGVRGFTKATALELGPRGIRVNSIHPGGILTAMGNPQGAPKEEVDKGYWMYPAQCCGEPADIAAAVAHLVSEDGSYMYGSEVVVDGGMTAGQYYMMMPGAPTKPDD